MFLYLILSAMGWYRRPGRNLIFFSISDFALMWFMFRLITLWIMNSTMYRHSDFLRSRTQPTWHTYESTYLNNEYKEKSFFIASKNKVKPELSCRQDCISGETDFSVEWYITFFLLRYQRIWLQYSIYIDIWFLIHAALMYLSLRYDTSLIVLLR